MKNQDSNMRDWSRRNFLQTVGVGVPTLKLMLGGTSAGLGQATNSPPPYDPVKFTPVDLTRQFNCSPADFGPRERAKRMSGDVAGDGLLRTPAGEQNFQGIPFLLGAEGVEKKRWIVLSTRASSCASRSLEIPVGQRAGFLCFTAFCDWDETETEPSSEDVPEKVGQRLADVVLVYDDGSEKALPIRRRFEVNSPTSPWGHLPFAAL